MQDHEQPQPDRQNLPSGPPPPAPEPITPPPEPLVPPPEPVVPEREPGTPPPEPLMRKHAAQYC